MIISFCCSFCDSFYFLKCHRYFILPDLRSLKDLLFVIFDDSFSWMFVSLYVWCLIKRFIFCAYVWFWRPKLRMFSSREEDLYLFLLKGSHGECHTTGTTFIPSFPILSQSHKFILDHPIPESLDWFGSLLQSNLSFMSVYCSPSGF